MATRTATPRKPRRLNTRRIIDRPRLFALLDASPARVKMLVAPAGYGKTTLAEQWVRRDGRRQAWFTARHSATDVAALALGIAGAASELVPGCDARLREYLRLSSAPADVETIAEILGEDLAEWPPDGWLVVDEYDEIARGAASERLVAALIEHAPVKVLIASRQRPSWVAARDVLYGEYLELGKPVLAMDSAEAAEVLAEEGAQVAAGLVALAEGWPAVIGLAAVAGADLEGDAEQVPESLYRFFADEVYLGLPEDVRRGLAELAVAPTLDDELVGALLGHERATVVRDAAVAVGILVERGSLLDLHPLCRAFLEERSEELGLVPGRDVLERCLEHYRGRRDWDAALDLIVRRGLAERLEALLYEALDEFLETGRLSTIEEWCEAAPRAHARQPVFLLARAEVALRRGRFAPAQSLAEAAAAHPGSDVVFRALSAAARAAHLASREEEALDLYRRAESAATTDEERRDAMWGQLRCLIELESPDAVPAMEQLAATVEFSNSREVVCSAAHRLHLQLRSGSVDTTEADRASELIGTFSDPLLVSAFLNVYAGALVLGARYVDADGVISNLLDVIEDNRFDFAVPHALCSVALTQAGLRRWQRATAAAEEAIARAEEMRDRHTCLMAFSVSVRILVQQGQVQRALALPIPVVRDALVSSRAEAFASRALALACAARVDEARALLRQACDSSSIEPRVLRAATQAVCALKSRDRKMLRCISHLEEVAFQSGALDLLVTAYRSTPDLLTLLFKVSVDRERLATLIRRAGDADLALAAGYSVAFEDEPLARLTPREREIHEFLLRGVSDREIAEALYISRATAKRHVQNIYNKLGLHSRAAIAVQAALARSGQATAATAASDPGSEASAPASNLNSSPRASR